MLVRWPESSLNAGLQADGVARDPAHEVHARLDERGEISHRMAGAQADEADQMLVAWLLGTAKPIDLAAA